MKGLAITFASTGPVINTDAYLDGFNTTVQNGMVDIGTAQGSDPMFPTRGTDLMRTALDGGIVNYTSARHASNFAALSTLTFTTSNEDVLAEERLVDLTLSPVELDVFHMKVEAQFTSSLGNIVGVVSTLPTNG
jgi:hypothetical protein